MTRKKLKEAIKNKKLPGDWLSGRWYLGFPMTLVVLIYLCVIYVLFKSINIPAGTVLMVFTIASLLLGTAVYCLINDRKLKSIATDGSREENRKLVIKTLKRMQWNY